MLMEGCFEDSYCEMMTKTMDIKVVLWDLPFKDLT